MSVFWFPCSHDVSIAQATTFGYLNPPSKASGIAVALFQGHSVLPQYPQTHDSYDNKDFLNRNKYSLGYTHDINSFRLMQTEYSLLLHSAYCSPNLYSLSFNSPFTLSTGNLSSISTTSNKFNGNSFSPIIARYSLTALLSIMIFPCPAQ